MNLRRQKPNDSLDMLLDTMCNTFGGIILLAVLVTLLTSRERHGGVATTTETQEMLQRRLTLAQDNLKQALQLQASLQTKTNDASRRSQVALLDTRQQIQDELKRVRELSARDARDLEASASSDPAERLQALNTQLAAAQAQKTAAQNALAASKENTKRMNTRVAALEKQTTDLVKDSQRQLRLPKEHETSKRVFYIIARYGRIYPCRLVDLSRNEIDIEWTSTLTSEKAEPIRGKGIDPIGNAAGLKSFFNNLSGQSVYVGFCVFEDSFPAFIQAKQMATESGLAYGWDPFEVSDSPVSFSDTGHMPKPQ